SLSDPHIWLHENGNDYARLNFDNNNGSNYWTIAAYIASNHRNDRLNFWNGTGGDVMTITGDGEVGIGVGISPKTTFHVGNGRRVLFGIDTLGNGDKLMFLPDLHAFRVGTVATGAASTYWNRDSIGLYSFASGYNTRAQGFGATAMGRDTEATNSYAFASGFFSNADGQYSTAMGFNTDAFALGSTALGYSTDAEANYSFAAGYFAEAQAIYSVAIGNAVRAQSYASMAVGRYNVGGGNATSWVAADPIFEIGIGTGPSTRANAMMVHKNGNVGIGTNFPSATLQIIGTTRIGSAEEITDGGSYLMDFDATLRPVTNNGRSLGNSTKRWNTVFATNGTINTSDRREKENIRAIPYGLTEIMQLEPVIFSWIDQPERGNKLGLIAQDVQPVLEEVVLDKDWVQNEENGEIEEIEAERMGVYYSDIIPVLIKAVQEQQELIKTQSEQLEALKAEVEALKKQ
ncbi:MAG: tail fiber domain-containing protein, partial [Bacteroidia bacterium]